MKRRSFFAIAGLSGAVVTLSACSGGDTKSDSGPITTDTKAELTLFYWDKSRRPPSRPTSRPLTRPTPTSR